MSARIVEDPMPTWTPAAPPQETAAIFLAAQGCTLLACRYLQGASVIVAVGFISGVAITAVARRHARKRQHVPSDAARDASDQDLADRDFNDPVSNDRDFNDLDLADTVQAARLAQTQAVDADRAKTDFLACMSHEIRTPLNSVIGFAELLVQLPDLPRKAKLYGQRIEAGAAALLTVVDDILDFSQVEAGGVRLEPKPFSPAALVDECVSMVQPAAGAKALQLRTAFDDLPRGAMGDANRLRQILLNLLNNAIKFTAEGSVTLSVRRIGGDRLVFSVRDTGIGISPVDQHRLFKDFSQVDSSIRRTYGGTGLGLAISKRLVEMMGGSIGVVSGLGEGSTFHFEIPLPSAEMPDESGPLHSETGGRALKILLVEDVALYPDLMQNILALQRHRVDVVGDGAEAIMAVQDEDYDVVLMDVQMPHVDGLTATRVIRALDHRCRHVPIIALTANVLPEQTFDSLDAGVDDILHKPCSVQQIFAMLDRYGMAPSRDEGPAPCADVEHERTVLEKLAALLGDAKVASLLESMAAALDARFGADASTQDGRAALRQEAHASIAGCGMLGFESFARQCRHIQNAPDDRFEAELAALRSEARATAAFARRLADTTSLRGPASLRPPQPATLAAF